MELLLHQPSQTAHRLWEFLTILPEVHLWGHTLMLDWKAWLSISALVHQVEVRTLCRPVEFIHTHPCRYGPCFVHWCTVMLEQEVAIPKKLGACNCPISLAMLKHSEFLFIVSKGPSPAPEKQPTPWSDYQMEKQDSLLQRTRLRCSRVQW